MDGKMGLTTVRVKVHSASNTGASKSTVLKLAGRMQSVTLRDKAGDFGILAITLDFLHNFC